MTRYEYKIYWIWLQQVLKYGNNKVHAINEVYKNAEELYNDSEQNWRLSGLFTLKEIKQMYEIKLDDAKIIYNRCLDLGQSVVTYEDEEYPERLRNIPNPPCVLYVKGNLPRVEEKICVAIVGSRDATIKGKRTAFKMSHDLAKRGAVIVSGGAIGIDAAAHNGAMQANGATLAVLACGINYDYLKANARLRSNIEKTGALISEYPPGYPVYSSNFVIRNRIVSGLSQCTIVVEAGEKSGSLITANLALDQNRDVFTVVPNDVRSSMAKGIMNLIRDGAKVITSVEDVINEYKLEVKEENFDSRFKVRKIKDSVIKEALDNQKIEKDLKEFTDKETFNNKHDKNNNDVKHNNRKKEDSTKNKNSARNKELPLDLSEDAKKVYNLLQNKKYHIDEMSLYLNMKVQELLPAITELEIYGLMRSYSGKMYEKI